MDIIGKLLGEWSLELNVWSVLFRVCVSLLLSAMIGCERSSKRHSAGLRTFIVISLGTTFAMLIDVYLRERFETGWFLISAASVVAIALITTNSILFSSRNQIRGLTTSAGLWAVGLLGLAVGAGLYTVAAIGFFAVLISLACFNGFEKYLKNRSNHFEVHLELTSSAYLKEFIATIRKLGLIIDDIEFNPAYVNSGLSVYTISLTVGSPELKKYKTHKEIIEAISSIDYVYDIEELNA
ncbi:MAG: MgtC/SapB family protein [Clostridia bacterium]|nr:MgtC/SapB family protein [Clostridia bacterium]MBO7401046.1 MgtC/SapB family protein [Clostridia bacterium]MBO7548694.1 MgtC/SapB family protein [Clostridia bacterium]MBP5237540.1 MgtC/SapB family protein [Clostridia bacterium]MBP5657183.1 MgtC/SapB family protein [Clostridia bacterium]